MREVAPFVLLACACGAAVSDRGRSPVPPPPALSTGPATSAAPAADGFDALAALGPSTAPGMREFARRAGGLEAATLLHAEASDACVRVAFAASAAIVGELVDGAGEVLASSGPAATEGVLAARGPVCVRKGDVVLAAGKGPVGTRVRWLAWQAP